MTETTPPPRSATSPRALPRLTLRSRTPEPAPAPEPPPAPAPAAPPQQPEMRAKPPRGQWEDPECLMIFRRLSALVPPGAWPATLPLDKRSLMAPRPMALGIAERVEALLPEAERQALHRAIRHFARCAPYLRAVAADGAQRWSDDGTAPVGAVSDEHKAAAVSMLRAKAKRRAKREAD